MSKIAEFEAEGPNGVLFKFQAPANSTPEQLQRYAFIEYQLSTQGSSNLLRQPGAPRPQQPPVLEAPAVLPPEPESETTEQFEGRLQKAAQEQEVRQAQMYGGATGAGLAAGRIGADAAAAAAQNLANRAEAGRIAAQQAAGIARPPTPPAAGPMPSDAISRIMQGTTDAAGTTGRAREAGFNVETAQRAAASREAERLAEELRQRGLIGRGTPQVLASMPGLTATPSGVLVPRQATTPPTAPTVPPRPSGLDQITATFGRMISPAATAARYVLPPLGLAAAGGETVRAKQMLEQESPDYTGAGLSGLAAASGLAALSPTMAPVAVPLGLGTGALQYMRSRLEPDRPISPAEERVASRPAFGIYPPMGRRRPSLAPR